MVSILNYFIILLLVTQNFIRSQQIKTCKTAIGESGLCIPITECSIIVQTIKSSPQPFNPAIVDYLNRSRCGIKNNTPHVCCAPRHITGENRMTPPPITTKPPPLIRVPTNDNEQIGKCKTAIGESGQCIPITECSIIVHTIKKNPQPFTPEVVDFLNRSRCGSQNNTPYVCCAPRHITSENRISPTNAPKTTSATAPSKQILTFNVENHPNVKLLPLSTCGRDSGNKISNGNQTDIGEFPWMALLRYNIPSKGLDFLCGGTLISTRYVLSAAHCVVGSLTDQLVSVRLGEHDISREIDCEMFGWEEICAPPVQDIAVEEVHYHPKFDKPKFSNDVAVIRLKTPAELNKSVKPICLPVTTQAQIFEKLNLTRAFISGWGFTEKRSQSDQLIKAILPIVDEQKCFTALRSVLSKSLKMSELICAGGEKGVDNCRGDSGGPLFFAGRLNDNIPRYIQYGIITAGSYWCNDYTSYPGIYTRIATHLEWILDHLRS